MPPNSMQRLLATAAGQFDRGLRRRLATDLRGAIGRSELTLHYQPRVRLRDGARLGAEALLRWHHARRGEVPPADFIPIAEDSDLIVALGGWVLRRAAADAMAHPELGRVAVNVSARQVASGALPRQVEEALAVTGLPPARLELELTESLPLEDAPEVVAMLQGLRDRGISLALDDFGTGYASFARLRRLPFTTLKLDHSLIDGVPGAERDLAILRALRDLAQALRLRLVAEGVERVEQAAILADLGFEEAQGYLFGGAAPLPLPGRLAPGALAPAPGRTTVSGRCPPSESPSSAPASPA
ncbi:EAL domain-containing protein [Paracraurococcus lichenis]|uniref:EAL domain-containing protein n=1 Tax=Paracraurococcus lichenis TaxID=3064888 RepID=A0ABT9DWY8_9PROT|nr:EAL domain-containing protein [Paracraurococcus sp. LOR1-02]MDO9708415.1 EAL domain-containing protein [Paracraurococcus sp. LOR1-02]